jgi:hypothetical protein
MGQAGDVLQAAYAVELQPARGTDAMVPSPMIHISDSDVLTLYLDRALKNELAAQPTATELPASTTLPADGTNAITSTNAALTTPTPQAIYPARPLESLRMLDLALIQNGDRLERFGRNSKGDIKTRGIAQGIEGLGDEDPNSPFLILANGPGGLSSRIENIDAHTQDRRISEKTKSTTREPRSLHMLEQRIMDNR